MEQTQQLIDTLKKELRSAGKTYADVAQQLELSEASVKRLFSERNLSLVRLEKIASLIGMDLVELIEAMRRRQKLLTQLTEQQEKEIASDMLLVLVAVSVINGHTLADLLALYDLTEAQCIQKLAKLDRLKILELLPGNRIRMLVAPNFNWRPRGPIEKLFREKVEQDFFNSQFNKDSERLIVLNGVLSSAANAEMQSKIEKLAHEFNELIQRESKVPMSSKFGNTMVIALRQWRYSLFESYSRNK